MAACFSGSQQTELFCRGQSISGRMMKLKINELIELYWSSKTGNPQRGESVLLRRRDFTDVKTDTIT
nr:hypothetical protein SYMBAF_190064 [Serratia symbiotica]